MAGSSSSTRSAASNDSGSRCREQVDRIADRRSRRQQPGEPVPRRLAQFHYFQAGAFAGVSGQHARAAAVADDRHPAATWKRCEIEKRCYVEQFGERVDARNACLVEQTVDGNVRCSGGGSVRECAAATCHGAARLHCNDRLAPADPGRDACEFPWIAEGFEIKRADFGGVVLLPEAQQVVTRDVGLVPAETKVARPMPERAA